MSRFLALLLLLLFSRALFADEMDPLRALRDGGEGQVSGIAEDFTLTLADGRRLRLAEIELPRRPLSDPSSLPFPPAQSAREALRPLLQGSLRIRIEGPAPDRWGRWPAHLITADGRWVQTELLRQGWARVFTTATEHALALPLLRAETPARDAGLGLWGNPATALRRSDQTSRLIDSWQVVEGRVTSVHKNRGGIFVDLGEDWRRNLGLRLSRRTAARLPGDIQAMTGRRLRVRGWIGKGIGPIMDISHAEQIEAMDDWPPRPATAPEPP